MLCSSSYRSRASSRACRSSVSRSVALALGLEARAEDDFDRAVELRLPALVLARGLLGARSCRSPALHPGDEAANLLLDGLLDFVGRDRHALRAVTDRRTAVVLVTLPVRRLRSRRPSGCRRWRNEDAQASEQALRLRTPATRKAQTLDAVESLHVDQRREGFEVHERHRSGALPRAGAT